MPNRRLFLGNVLEFRSENRKAQANLDVALARTVESAPIYDFVWEHERKHHRSWSHEPKHRRAFRVSLKDKTRRKTPTREKDLYARAPCSYVQSIDTCACLL